MRHLGSCRLLLLLTWPGAMPCRAIAQGTPDRIRYGREMLSALRSEEERQWTQLSEHLAYSGSGPATDKRHSHHGPVRVLILTASDSGWSAIVVHDSMPGAACGVFYGSAPPPIDPTAEDGSVTCTPATSINQATLLSPTGKRVYLERELAPDARPVAGGCSKPTAWSGVVRLRLLVDASGHLKSSPLRVIDADSLDQVTQAVDLVASCRWTPGRANGAPVPTVIDVSLP